MSRPVDVYSFCEPVWASSISRWHIRKVPSGEALKTGGGITTAGLCGTPSVRTGWDLEVPIDEHHLGHACPRCVAAYREQTVPTNWRPG
jgi:hypothetical protein